MQWSLYIPVQYAFCSIYTAVQSAVCIDSPLSSMKCIVKYVLCSLYSFYSTVQCAFCICIVQCCVQCVLCSLYRSLQCVLCSLHSAVCIVQWSMVQILLCIVQCAVQCDVHYSGVQCSAVQCVLCTKKYTLCGLPSIFCGGLWPSDMILFCPLKNKIESFFTPFFLNIFRYVFVFSEGLQKTRIFIHIL